MFTNGNNPPKTKYFYSEGSLHTRAPGEVRTAGATLAATRRGQEERCTHSTDGEGKAK